MIKTLYLRVVVTFITVVVVSVIGAFFIGVARFQPAVASNIQNGLLSTGHQIVKLAEEVHPSKVDDFLIRMSQLTQTYVVLVDDKGVKKRIGSYEGRMPPAEADQAAVEAVLQGGLFRSPLKQPTTPDNIYAGLPLQLNGNRYALFVYAKFHNQMIQVRQAEQLVLFCVLIIGSILIVGASSFIVNPLKSMTLATKRLAKGDFNVSLKVKRRDELGLLAESFNHMAGELKQMERMRQDFVSNVSHEIQTPLTSIRGFSKALQQEGVGEAYRKKYLSIIEHESERLARLSENLLKLASLESEHHPLHLSLIDLDEQIRQVVVVCEPLWSAKDLHIELCLPRTKIPGDPDLLSQVWTNLLHNSIKFTPNGGTIEIEVRHLTDRVEVKFSDSGIGIGPEEIGIIFQRFFKADKSRQSSVSGGSGLGLAIAKKIVDIHQGEIRASSKPGQGAVFTVTLPVVR